MQNKCYKYYKNEQQLIFKQGQGQEQLAWTIRCTIAPQHRHHDHFRRWNPEFGPATSRIGSPQLKMASEIYYFTVHIRRGALQKYYEATKERGHAH